MVVILSFQIICNRCITLNYRKELRFALGKRRTNNQTGLTHHRAVCACCSVGSGHRSHRHPCAGIATSLLHRWDRKTIHLLKIIVASFMLIDSHSHAYRSGSGCTRHLRWACEASSLPPPPCARGPRAPIAPHTVDALPSDDLALYCLVVSQSINQKRDTLVVGNEVRVLLTKQSLAIPSRYAISNRLQGTWDPQKNYHNKECPGNHRMIKLRQEVTKIR